MNEFVIILKSINFKNGKLKILRNFKIQWLHLIFFKKRNCINDDLMEVKVWDK